MFSSSAPPPRVLCVTLRPGSVGHAVLDGFGVPDDAFFTSRFDHLASRKRFPKLLQLLRTSCERFHPTRVVLGLPSRARPERVALAKRLARHLASPHVRVSIRYLRDAAAVFVERVRYSMANELVGLLAEHFVPDLKPFVDRARRCAWYWRPAWYAVAMALAALIEYHPLVAAALARPRAFLIEPFRAALMAAERRLTPRFV